jgi:hypothetical protein
VFEEFLTLEEKFVQLYHRLIWSVASVPENDVFS